MRILINDHAGHPFQVELSRALASRGHDVLHCFTQNLQTPRGDLKKRPGDERLEIVPVDIGESFERYGYVRRLRHELALGRRLANIVENFRPDTVISANTPLLTQRIIQSATLAHGSQFVFWLQDILSVGIGQAMRRRNRIFGGAIGLAFERLENLILNDSNAIVAISEDFIPVLIHRGIPAEKISVIHNWAPLDALPMTSKNNNWSSAHNLADKTVVMYTGTLGLKHNPGLLVALAEALQTREDVRLVIISEGLGADYVAEAMSHSNSGRLQQLPFQPFSQLAEVLGSADILLAILEKDAGQFAVPSKILTYMCSGRAIVAAMPGENLASRIVCEAGAGIVTEPEDDAGFVRAVECLLDDATRRARHAQNARSFAETGFDISSITSRFENLLNQ